jgi:hypothetical protein
MSRKGRAAPKTGARGRIAQLTPKNAVEGVGDRHGRALAPAPL